MCLPVYDHFCTWLKAAVYLRTMKAYVYLLVFMPLDAVFSLIISTVAMSRYGVNVLPFTLSIIVSAMMVAFCSVNWTHQKLRLLAFHNCVNPERHMVSITQKFHRSHAAQR